MVSNFHAQGVIGLHVVPVIVVVMIYEICSIRQARDRERIAPVNHLIDSDELHYDVPPLESFPIRRRLQDLRLQIANLNREVDEFGMFAMQSAKTLSSKSFDVDMFLESLSYSPFKIRSGK